MGDYCSKRTEIHQEEDTPRTPPRRRSKHPRRPPPQNPILPIIKRKVLPGTFPEQLGPFGIVPTSYGARDIRLYPDQKVYYEMGKRAFRSSNLKHLLHSGFDIPLVAQMSPANPVTLKDNESKVAANIPIEAVSFVWSYPSAVDFEEVRKNARELDFTDPDVIFLAVGGYIYFNENGEICGVNTLIHADHGGLQFGEPEHFDRDFIPGLAKVGRFQEITIKDLNDVGAQHFCWLRPKEELVSESGKKKVFCPNGGFVYLFHKNVYAGTKDELEMDRVFSVLSGDDPHYMPDDDVKGGDHSSEVLESFALVRKQIGCLNNLMDQVPITKANTWSIRDVGIWLDSVELHVYKDTFEEKNIDGQTLLGFDEENIKGLVEPYHIKKVMDEVKKLQAQAETTQEIERLQFQIEGFKICAVCCAAEKNSVLKPCGHICCCLECVNKLKKCPLCRAKIEEFEKCYV